MQKLDSILASFCLGLALSACATVGQVGENDSGSETDQDTENPDHCQPQNCSQLEKQCGTWDDECHELVSCGTCPEGIECTFDGLCPGADCREVACVGFTYCNEITGECLSGCGSEDQCDENERCDLATHECEACGADHHVCENLCVSNNSVDHCGDRCEPCPVGPQGWATCDGTICSIECDEFFIFNPQTLECECDDGYHECFGTCVWNGSVDHCGNRCEPCPSDPHGTPTCDGTNCGLECDELYRFDESSMACVCIEGYHECFGTCVWNGSVDHCGDRCEPCPSDPHGTPTCDGTECSLDCDEGWSLSDGACGLCEEGLVYLDGECLVLCSTTVDSEGRVGNHNSIAVDSEGVPHISYHEWGFADDSKLKYATWNGSDWDIEIIDEGGDTGQSSSIAIDSSDLPHIIYAQHVGGTTALGYARWTGSEWIIETIDSEETIGVYGSLALDSLDRPHISYHEHLDSGSRNLKYAHFTGSEWVFERISSIGISSYGTSIALDSSDRPHISFGTGSDTYDLKYARFTGGVWEIETVDSSDRVGNRSSLALDSRDYPHISYRDVRDDWVKYASWTGTIWEIQSVGREDSTGDGTSIAIDSSDRPHIVYRNIDTLGIQYAQWISAELDWQVVTPESILGTFPSMSIALDSRDFPHFSHRTILGADYSVIYSWVSTDGSCTL